MCSQPSLCGGLRDKILICKEVLHLVLQIKITEKNEALMLGCEKISNAVGFNFRTSRHKNRSKVWYHSGGKTCTFLFGMGNRWMGGVRVSTNSIYNSHNGSSTLNYLIKTLNFRKTMRLTP